VLRWTKDLEQGIAINPANAIAIFNPLKDLGAPLTEQAIHSGVGRNWKNPASYF
jgi:hypothetical protein